MKTNDSSSSPVRSTWLLAAASGVAILLGAPLVTAAAAPAPLTDPAGAATIDSAALDDSSTLDDSATQDDSAAQDDKEEQKKREEEFDQRYKDARGDATKLWELYEWCDAYGLQSKHKRVLGAILKADENDRRAHELLGHEFYDGQWWDDAKKLAKYRLKKEEADAKANGWVQYKGRWVDPKDIPFLERGLVRDEDGNWVDKEAQEKLAAGWIKQDLEWIDPADKANVEKGLWKCGGQWLEVDKADRFHADLGREWRIPVGDFVIRSTLPRATTLEIAADLRRASRDVERFFGRQPVNFHILLLRSVDQYNEFSGGLGGTGGTDLLGWSGVRGAYFADGNWNDRDRMYDGIATALWDLDSDTGAQFGRHFARFAFGMGAVEALDSSPDARERMMKAGEIDEGGINAFYNEKMLPPVLRYGFASYVDRYFIDAAAGAGADVHWARKWSVQNITARGGLDPLARVLPFAVEIRDEQSAATAGHLLNQAGLLVSFILDAGCEPVVEAHKAFKEAFVSGDPSVIEKASKGLIDAIRKNETAYRRWSES